MKKTFDLSDCFLEKSLQNYIDHFYTKPKLREPFCGWILPIAARHLLSYHVLVLVEKLTYSLVLQILVSFGHFYQFSKHVDLHMLAILLTSVGESDF